MTKTKSFKNEDSSDLSPKLNINKAEFRSNQNQHNETNVRILKKREKYEGEMTTTKSSNKIIGNNRSEKRDYLPYPVLSVRYFDPCLTLSEDRLTCTGSKGWSSIFATHCAEKGKWYYEVEILNPLGTLKFISQPGGKSKEISPHTRLGWACRYQRYDMPIAHNAFGYALRDIDGAVINSAIKKKYATKSFGVGDTVGCYLSLNEPTWWLSDPRNDRKLYEHLQAGILCNPKEPPDPKPNIGSFVEFSLNGHRCGSAFTNIYNGAYHPAISLYMGSKVKVTFGPEFRYPPNSEEGWKPACELMRPYVV